MTAEILSIGDELLIGQVVNSNQAFIAERLNRVGIDVVRMTTVGDDAEAIHRAFTDAWSSRDVVTVTGGLGPTHDDITRAAVCRFFGTDLVQDAEALANVRRIFDRRKLTILPRNEDQAMVPRGCTVMQNRLGTAPGYFFEKDGKSFIVMPGVPFEMKAMVDGYVTPFFEKHPSGSVIRHRTLKTTGIAESFLAERIGDISALFRSGEGITLAFLPSPMGVRLRITGKGTDARTVDERIAEVERAITSTAGKYLYAGDDVELEEVLGRALAERNLTISVAESCTGGLILDRLTNVPGSSRYVERGFVTYSNASKHAELGVPLELIEQHGAVSREVAMAMAEGARKTAGTDIGLSTTGIAGPQGGSAEKPVGTVWIGYSDAIQTFAMKFNFGEDRRRTKERASQAALEMVRRKVLKIEDGQN
jgi:nicotinamide-nucleotide amidase